MKETLKKLGKKYEKVLLNRSADNAFNNELFNNIENVQNRRHLRLKYAELLETDIEENTFNINIIKWSEWEKVSDDFILFLFVKKMFLKKELEKNRKLLKGEDNEILSREALNNIIEKNKEKWIFSKKEKIQILADIIFAKTKGVDILQPLLENKLSEVGFRSSEYIYILLGEESIWIEFLKFENEIIPDNIIKKEVKKYGQADPLVTIDNDLGHRITVAGGKIVPTKGAVYYNQRMFDDVEIKTLEDIVSLKTASNDLIMLLKYISWSKSSYIISGDDTGLGKTSLLRAMINEIPNNMAIGIIDSQNEINAEKLYPEKNIITLINNDKHNFRYLFDGMLKQSVKQIIIGEIISPDHIDALIDAWMRLKCGGGGTFHSATAEKVVDNLINKAVACESYKNSDERASRDIGESLDFIIHLSRSKVNRKRIIIEKVLKIEPINKNKYYSKKEVKEIINLKKIIQIGAEAIAKYMYPKKYVYNEIVSYDEVKDTWDIKKLIDPNKINSKNKKEKIERWLLE